MSLSVNNAFKHNFLSEPQTRLLTDNNNQIGNGTDKTIQVWSQYNFPDNVVTETVNNKTTWSVENESKVEDEMEDVKIEEEPLPVVAEKEEEALPSHHARRPMNAFLIFCKKHRPIVRERFPNLENRGVTRILGEWWALLDEQDKAPYTSLAKEYKDAFLSANPDFKWYKLPAPPKRAPSVRPSTQKIQSPMSSPILTNLESEFTPGKLADESQLGGLTSLMNNNFSPSKHVKLQQENNNNVEKSDDHIYDDTLTSPVSNIVTTLPPKPFKKRVFDKFPDNNSNVARSILNDEDEDGNMTNQDLMDKVVDKIFTQDEDGLNRELVRKSGRQCKGKRYEKFMVEGRLLGNKRDTKLTSQRENEFGFKPETETPNLDHTIKRLAERTNMKSLLETQEKPEVKIEVPEVKSNTADFNLDVKIKNLPSLSYEAFHQKKKESKKRKNRIRTDSESKAKSPRIEVEPVVGSKKRKNKQSITHLEKKDESSINDGLLVLAEVAANTEKINNGME